MFKYAMLLALLVVMMVFGLRPTHHAPIVRAQNYTINHKAIEKAKAFTVLISVENWGGLERGSGVLIDSTHVLTCFHVADGEGDLWVYPQGREVYKATREYGDRAHDLAILALDHPVRIKKYPAFATEYRDGEPIYIIGNIMGAMHWFVSYGVISSSMGPYLLTDGLVLGGDSGGPWINNRGQIVAISDFGFQDGSGHPLGVNGGVSSETIEKFLKDWKTPAPTFMLQLQ